MQALGNLVIVVVVVVDATEIKMTTGWGIRSNVREFLISETRGTDFCGLEGRYLLTTMFM